MCLYPNECEKRKLYPKNPEQYVPFPSDFTWLWRLKSEHGLSLPKNIFLLLQTFLLLMQHSWKISSNSRERLPTGLAHFGKANWAAKLDSLVMCIDLTGGVPLPRVTFSNSLAKDIFWAKILNQGYIFLPKSLAKCIFFFTKTPKKWHFFGEVIYYLLQNAKG